LKFYHGAADSLQFSHIDSRSRSYAAWTGFAESCGQLVVVVYLAGSND
jgi:hypothetical protein